MHVCARYEVSVIKPVADHIIKIYDVKYLNSAVWIIMEYCDLGDLNNFFKNHATMVHCTESKVKLMRQIIKGIAFLHSRNIVHRDIKPGNKLLTSSSGDHVVVKLGDFGLSKILDPDSLTSAMSSNVGTLSFKAPEFWDKKPDDKGRYHRNIDVYAAGLTAMLQARSGKSVTPKAEGSLKHAETLLPIGLAAFSRKDNNQPDVNVVEVHPRDNDIIKRVKKLIRRMTDISPTDRPSASSVESMINKVVSNSDQNTN